MKTGISRRDIFKEQSFSFAMYSKRTWNMTVRLGDIIVIHLLELQILSQLFSFL